VEAGEPGRILLIDDDRALGGYLTRVLTRGGFAVTHELDSVGALQRIETEPWDLLITDIELPGMTGLELLDRVRQRVPDLPVAVLTGHATVDYAVSALRSSAAEFLQMPISADDLVAKATELVEAGRTARAAGRETVLAIGAHPDDVEIGAAGALLAHRAAGDAVAILTLSLGRVYCFQSPSATVDYRPTHFVTIDDHIGRKLKAIDAFTSQAGVRDYLEPDLIASTARYWSRYGGGSHAEPFEAVRHRAGGPAQFGGEPQVTP
jgi:CheY-like chemotaxis protein